MITTEAAKYIGGLKKFLEYYDMQESLHDGEIDEFCYKSKEGLSMLIWHQGIYTRMKFIGVLNITMDESEFCPGFVSPNSTIQDFTAELSDDNELPLKMTFNLLGITIKCKRMEIVEVYPDEQSDK